MSLKLIRIREKGGVRGFGENKHQVMAESWLDAIKDYLSVNAAMKDWTFAWRLDENEDVVRVLDALKDKQSLLMKQAIVGKAVRCLASLAITTFDNVTDFLLAAQFYNQGDVRSASITIAFPLLSNLVQSLWSFADNDSLLSHSYRFWVSNHLSIRGELSLVRSGGREKIIRQFQWQ